MTSCNILTLSRGVEKVQGNGDDMLPKQTKLIRMTNIKLVKRSEIWEVVERLKVVDHEKKHIEDDTY